jgi:SAM-dependent methyltransferase
MPRMESLLERIRRAELQPLMSYFPPGSRILELGGGSGFQAAILSSRGCGVCSIDVASRPDPLRQRYGRQYFPVTTYDGLNIPFADSSFDVVYSSHMLYHAVELDSMLAEISRVLRPGGVAIHVVPSASWRFWTAVAHYPNLVRKGLTRPSKVRTPAAGAHKPTPPQAADASPPLTPLRRARLLLTVRPLGPSSNVFVEWSSFRRRQWRAAFLGANFRDVKAHRGPLFYTGHLMWPGLPFSLRSLLALALGPASFAWIMRPVDRPAQSARSTSPIHAPL